MGCNRENAGKFDSRIDAVVDGVGAGVADKSIDKIH